MSARYSDPVLAYFAEHGIDPEVAASYAAERDGSIVFTVTADDGSTFQRERSMNGGPKVKQPTGIPLATWWPKGRPEGCDVVLVCEGESDALAALSVLPRSPLPDLRALPVAAIPGTGYPTARLVADLAGVREVLIAFDGDKAGRKKAAEVIAALRDAGARPVPVELPDDSDLAELIVAAEDPGETLASLIADARAAAEGHTTGPDELCSFALTIDDFIAAKSDIPPALIGTEDDNVLPAFGLALLIGKGGKGKTTLAVELALHLSAGVDWLGFTVPRPLRVLMIENEGPQEPFRRKLERKLGAWHHPIQGEVFIYAEDWGQARLDGDGFVEPLNRFIDENKVDLVFGDPLDTLGMEGVGSPEDTRNMVDRFKAAGLFTRTAWWLLHHSRKEKVDDAVDEASGAWGGRPDAMIGLEKLPGNRARLSFPKLRWGRRDGFAYILGYDPDTEAFDFISEDAGEERDYAKEIEELLEGHRWWLTAKEIAASQEAAKPGIGANVDTVKDVLDADPDRFVSRTGDAAKAVDRHHNATVWGLTRWPESHESDPAFCVSSGDLAAGVTRLPPRRGESHPSQTPRLVDGLTQAPESGGGCPSHPNAPAQGCRYCQDRTAS